MDNPSKSTIQRRRKAAGELGPVGAPVQLVGANQVRITFDAESRAIGEALARSDGTSLSSVCRRLLKACKP